MYVPFCRSQCLTVCCLATWHALKADDNLVTQALQVRCSCLYRFASAHDQNTSLDLGSALCKLVTIRMLQCSTPEAGQGRLMTRNASHE